MTAIIERTPRTVTVRMSTRRWNRLQQMEQALQQPKGSNAKHHYRHEALCGMFKSDATEAELVEEYLKRSTISKRPPFRFPFPQDNIRRDIPKDVLGGLRLWCASPIY